MSNERQYTIQFNTQTMATCLTHAVEMAQAQVDNGNVYVTITEEGGEPWEFNSVQDVYGPRESPTPKTDAVMEAVKQHEFLHRVFMPSPFQVRVDRFDMDHFTQPSKKTKKALAKLIKKAKRIRKGKRK